MSANKYANLPDIDTAQDIYETDDIFPSAHGNNGDSSDEELALPTRTAATRGRNAEFAAGREELDSSHLIDPDEASKKFRKAEKRRERQKARYTYPPESPSSPASPSTLHGAPERPVPIAHRLRALQAELASLEVELADPSNPRLHREREEDNVDPGELIRGLVDVRVRLEKISKGKEGRGKLVNVVIGNGEAEEGTLPVDGSEDVDKENTHDAGTKDGKGKGKGEPLDVRSVVEMDKRVGELEKLVGSSSAALDEVSPLPPPLLPMLTRLNTQLALLTQPRHIDSISRRLKLLLSDLERVSNSAAAAKRQHGPPAPNAAPTPPALQDQLLPILTRLGPALPHIPHILTRLRTLAALHTAAGEFNNTLTGLEDEQRRARESLKELDGAVESVAKSLEENRKVVGGNVAGLEERVEGLLRRLDELSR